MENKVLLFLWGFITVINKIIILQNNCNAKIITDKLEILCRIQFCSICFYLFIFVVTESTNKYYYYCIYYI